MVYLTAPLQWGHALVRCVRDRVWEVNTPKFQAFHMNISTALWFGSRSILATMADQLLSVRCFPERHSQAGRLQFPRPDAPTSSLLSGFQLVGQEVRGREEGEDLGDKPPLPAGSQLWSTVQCLLPDTQTALRHRSSRMPHPPGLLSLHQTHTFQKSL